jgi:pimeloyl-ACP methyl ester carboxylesterase
MVLPALAAALACLPATATPLADGLHERLETTRGPVHLWCATDARPELVVVYVHGYYDDADEAFSEHRLASQFRASGVPALFVAIDGPTGPKEKVRWTSYRALEATLAAHLGEVPTRVLAIGHSGGNRTLRAWLDEGAVTDLVLLDGFYGDPTPWTTFLQKVPAARLQLVGVHTFAKAAAWRQGLPEALQARTSQEQGHTNHMGVVTDSVWIPMLVRARLAGPRS